MRENNQKLRQFVYGAVAAGALLCGAVAASAQVASTTYRSAGRDPFAKYKPPIKRLVVKKPLGPVAPPSIQQRIEQYKAHKLAAMNAQRPAPKPTTALLLSEVQVTGIFRTPRGYAAMVEATPINLSYVIYPGERFYDGMLVAIEESRLVFRHETLWTNGHREVAVDTKPLRQPDAVADSLTTTRTPENSKSSEPAKPAAEASESKTEKVSEVRKQ